MNDKRNKLSETSVHYNGENNTYAITTWGSSVTWGSCKTGATGVPPALFPKVAEGLGSITAVRSC